jgi:hypothetical protein
MTTVKPKERSVDVETHTPNEKERAVNFKFPEVEYTYVSEVTVRSGTGWKKSLNEEMRKVQSEVI